jgi:hypothetical protein
VSIWNDATSAAVAKRFAEAAANDAWSSQFRDRNGRPPALRVGAIEDRSGKLVPVDGLAAAIAEALTATGKLIPASGQVEADFAISGSLIAAAEGTEDGTPVTYFGVDLRVCDAKSGDPVWPFAIEQAVAGR